MVLSRGFAGRGTDRPGSAYRLRAQVDSLELHLVREVVSRGIPAEVGAVDPRAYLMGALTMSPTEAAATVKMAEAFGLRLSDTGAALAEGHICRERARAIVDVVTGLPAVASVEQVVEAEKLLLSELAGQLNGLDIRRLQKVLDHYIDPDGRSSPADEAAKAEPAGVHLRSNGDGTQTFRCRTDTDGQHRPAAGRPGTAVGTPTRARTGEQDSRSPAVRRAEWRWPTSSHSRCATATCRPPGVPVRTSSSPSPSRACSTDAVWGFTATGEHPVRGRGPADLPADADLTAIRLDTEGVPLSMGRTRRTVSPQQWLAPGGPRL